MFLFSFSIDVFIGCFFIFAFLLVSFFLSSDTFSLFSFSPPSERNKSMAVTREQEAKERERRLAELSEKRTKARQQTAVREARKFEKSSEAQKKAKDSADAKIRNEEEMVLKKERELERDGTSKNAKKMMRVARRQASVKGMYLGSPDAPIMKLKLNDSNGAQKTLEIRALVGDDTLDGRKSSFCPILLLLFYYL